ncbi:hypothetical protein RFI_08982 [Reticulomyxa filosa]|uniref:Uncharacterized protein n=1 Tax=Reticulomyxa filosa TaxID=46433 RepID=X6NR03_RETFI|nr:hypothetical protein RFI_08982 [Reticulomyxa filosa]|eukprot:ETO28149.1 hypothetical protein RFI_08982 [Reticulomyxa filosa]
MSQDQQETVANETCEDLKSWLIENDLGAIVSQLESSLTLEALSNLSPEQEERLFEQMTMSMATRSKLKNALQELQAKKNGTVLKHEGQNMDSVNAKGDQVNSTLQNGKESKTIEPHEDDAFSNDSSKQSKIHMPVLDPKFRERMREQKKESHPHTCINVCSFSPFFEIIKQNKKKNYLATMSKIVNGKRAKIPLQYHKKIVMAGAQSVGKSCIAIRLVRNTFDANMQATLGSSFLTYTLHVDYFTFELDIWDSHAGIVNSTFFLFAPFFNGKLQIQKNYDRMNDAMTLMNTFSFAEVSRIRENATAHQILIALVGNKCDLKDQREVNFDEVYSYAKEENLLFVEASAKTGENIHELFLLMAKCLPLEGGHVQGGHLGSVDLNTELSKSKGCC